jgi:hypothetical protein
MVMQMHEMPLVPGKLDAGGSIGQNDHGSLTSLTVRGFTVAGGRMQTAPDAPEICTVVTGFAGGAAGWLCGTVR